MFSLSFLMKVLLLLLFFLCLIHSDSSSYDSCLSLIGFETDLHVRLTARDLLDIELI